MKFLPREEKFFGYFNQQVGIIDQAVKLLQASCDSGTPGINEAADRITNLEHQADTILHEIYDRLNQTFITPIDPEDIHALAALLDDVMDYIEDASHRMAAYEIPEITPQLRELVHLIGACVSSLAHAFTALEKQESVLKDCIEINRLEEKADQLERRAVADLFKQEKDPIRLLKYKEIYEVLELATDACEDVADHLQSVLVKNS